MTINSERNARKMSHFLRKTERCAKKNLNQISNRLCGQSSPSFSHSYNNTFSVFKTGKDKRPLLTVSTEGEYRIPLFKLILIILGILSAAALIKLIAKKIAKHRQRKLIRKAAKRDFYDYEDDLPF